MADPEDELQAAWDRITRELYTQLLPYTLEHTAWAVACAFVAFLAAEGFTPPHRPPHPLLRAPRQRRALEVLKRARPAAERGDTGGEPTGRV